VFEGFLRELYAVIADQLWNNGFDALVMSTLNDSHLPADFDHSLQRFSIDGHEMPQTFFASLTLPWNILNTHPVVAAPAGLTSQNMPAGIQIVTRPYDDVTALRIAQAYEAATDPLFSNGSMPDFR
jgi:Asp-tRNA(Asn)/Glu-tRNA(Gln) amidotransferase A subunit family amidase